jgi:hypothetical protein
MHIYLKISNLKSPLKGQMATFLNFKVKKLVHSLHKIRTKKTKYVTLIIKTQTNL